MQAMTPAMAAQPQHSISNQNKNKQNQLVSTTTATNNPQRHHRTNPDDTGRPRRTRGESVAENDCSRTISYLWMQNKLLRDTNLRTASPIHCPLAGCERMLNNFELLLDHLPLCDRLPLGRYWCWTTNKEASIPVQCHFHRTARRAGGTMEDAQDRRPLSPETPLHPHGFHPNLQVSRSMGFRSSTTAPTAHGYPGWPGQEGPSTASSPTTYGLHSPEIRMTSGGVPQIQSSSDIRGVFSATQAMQNNVFGTMGSGTSTTMGNPNQLSFLPPDMTFNLTNAYAPRDFAPQWMGGGEMVGGAGSRSSQGMSRNPASSPWQSDEITGTQQPRSTHNQMHDDFTISLLPAAPVSGSSHNYHFDSMTSAAGPSGASGRAPQAVAGSSQAQHTLQRSVSASMTPGTHQHRQSLQYTQSSAQDTLLAKLKGAFYSRLRQPIHERTAHLASVQAMEQPDVWVGSLNELASFISSKQTRGPVNKICFVYLTLAMAHTLGDYLGVKIPESITRQLDENFRAVIRAPEATPLNPVFEDMSSTFLDAVEFCSRQDLRDSSDIACPCSLSPNTSISIMNKIKKRIPTIQFPQSLASFMAPAAKSHQQGHPPNTNHRQTIRNLELELLRLRPGYLPCTPRGRHPVNHPSPGRTPAITATEMSPDDYFQHYIPAVREECSDHYCPHITKAKYHVLVTQLIKTRTDGPQDSSSFHRPRSQTHNSTAHSPLDTRGLVDRATSPSYLAPASRQLSPSAGYLSSGNHRYPPTPSNLHPPGSSSSLLAIDTNITSSEGPVSVGPSNPPPHPHVYAHPRPQPQPGPNQALTISPPTQQQTPANPPRPQPSNRNSTIGLHCPAPSCQYIAKGQNAKKLLKRHGDALHNPDKKRFQCPHCERKLTRKDNLGAHIQKKHKDMKNLGEA